MKMLKLIISASLLLLSVRAFSLEEVPVTIIPLAPPLDQAQTEISGLSWCDDKLILLPQYPERFANDGNHYFYYLERAQIENHLDGNSSAPLKAMRILVDEKQLRKTIPVFDGFEAITCKDNKIWLSIEAVNFTGSYQSYVVPGIISFGNQPKIEIDQQRLASIETQSNMRNMGDEAIVMVGENVIAIHEVNDKRVVANPKARRVDRQTGELSELDFPNMPFRITDATSLDHNDRFWVINYKYSGDKFSRNAEDPITHKYGEGDSHKKYYNVERLVELELKDQSIDLVNSAPISLKMTNVEGRNWEGLVRLGNRGFLLATDKHPKTLLGFIATQK